MDSIIDRVLSLTSAIDILREKGLEFEEITTDKLQSKNWHTGQTTYKDGIHKYFVKDGYEIAYYTEMMSTLHIFENPRPTRETWLEILA
jgi:hypothetical protein